jgi:aquaporin Z
MPARDRSSKIPTKAEVEAFNRRFRRGRSGSSPAAGDDPKMIIRLLAEVAGTFLLVFGLIATAVFTSVLPYGDDANPLGVGAFGAAFALGLSVMIAAAAFGPLSGGHFNPSVTLGLAAAGRFAWRDTGAYIVAQLIGGLLATTAVRLIAAGGPDDFGRRAVEAGFGSNGFGDNSPAGFGLGSAILTEIIITAVFVTVVIAVTGPRAPGNLAPVVIGFTLALFLLVAIPVDNGSMNPVRSFSTAVYAGGDWFGQVWVFLLFPLVGGLAAGFAHRLLLDRGLIPAES